MLARIVIGLSIVLTATSGASAAYLNWGCRGQLGEQQVIFTDATLLVIDDKAAFGDVHKLQIGHLPAAIETAEKSGKTVAAYENRTDDSGLVKEFEFSRDQGKRKLVLTQTSSRKISVERSHPTGRDFYDGIFIKTFRLTRDGEPARSITMQCRETSLSTCGGRCPRD